MSEGDWPDIRGVMMECGCAANSIHTTKEGKKIPACVVCAGIRPGAYTIAKTPPDFTGRRARCAYYGQSKGRHGRGNCDSEADSDPKMLAFFESHPDEDFDIYYCGCHGWD